MIKQFDVNPTIPNEEEEERPEWAWITKRIR
jgi:hypothetical protein